MRVSPGNTSRQSPGTLFHAAFVALACVTLLGASTPGGAVWLLLWPFAWGAAGLGWLWQFARRSPVEPNTHEGWRRVSGWAVAPLLAGATLVFVSAGWPLELRFRLSRSAFAADARAALAASSGDLPGGRERFWLGLYEVRRELYSGGVWYNVSGSGGVMGWGGFAYSPDGSPANSHDLGLGWFVWLRST